MQDKMPKLLVKCAFTILATISILFLATQISPILNFPTNGESGIRNPEERAHTWEPFNHTVPHNTGGGGWCPSATCANSPICTPCHRRFLLLVATGRSGSTTLIKMLNELPGVRLSGENKNQLKWERKAIENILLSRQFMPERNRTGAYSHNEIPDGGLSCATQKMFEMINPPTRDDMNRRSFDDSRTIMGFKTIKLHLKDDFDVAVRFVKDMFPCARVILNIRSNIEDQTLSRKNSYDTHKDIANISMSIQMENARIKTVARIFGDERARLIDMVDWTKEETGLKHLNDVVYWLGFRNCKFDSLYHENRDRYNRTRSTPISLGSDCHYPNNL